MSCPKKLLFKARLVKCARLNNSVGNSPCERIPCYQRRWLEIEGKDSSVWTQSTWQDAVFFLKSLQRTSRSDGANLQCSWGQKTTTIQLKNGKLHGEWKSRAIVGFRGRRGRKLLRNFQDSVRAEIPTLVSTFDNFHYSLHLGMSESIKCCQKKACILHHASSWALACSLHCPPQYTNIPSALWIEAWHRGKYGGSKRCPAPE